MDLKLIDAFCQISLDNIDIALKAVDKLVRNKEENTTYFEDVQSTLCSTTCSKRSIYSIFEEMKLIELIKYDEEVDSKFYRIIDEKALKSVKSYIITKYSN